MPPAGLPRPDEKTYAAVIASLETSLDNAASAYAQPIDLLLTDVIMPKVNGLFARGLLQERPELS
jgi:YesN/AraC family two-component response regulator